MKHSFLDLLCTSLIPVLRSDITAGTARNVHLIGVIVAALRAGPHKLSAIVLYDDLAVKAALLAVIALGVKLRIHYIVVDATDDLHYSLEIVLHIRNLYVAYSASGRQRLEFRLKGKLIERVHRLGNVNVI